MPQARAADGAEHRGALVATPTAGREGRLLTAVTQCATADGCTVTAYEATSGRALWQRQLSNSVGATPIAAYPGGSPAVEQRYLPETDSLLVTLDGAAAPAVTYALDAASGSVQWLRQTEGQPSVDSGAASF